uniref:Uncharacterized protein n=1 Tax=Rhizophora mucronata TaxID=61149 RepID=A0A2P2NRW0_RHIMU
MLWLLLQVKDPCTN